MYGAVNVIGSVSASAYTGAGTGLTSIPNSALTNNSITVNGVSVALGGTLTQGQVLNGAISGSGQVAIASTSGFGTYINQALLTTSSPTFAAVSATTFTGALSGTATNATTAGGLAVASGRNNSANQIVRTDANGYIQAGYINSSNGNEGNNSSPSRVWGTNGSDDYLRTYLTSALSVSYASSAGSVSGLTLTNSSNGINPDNVTQNQIGYNTSVSLFGQTDGGLHSSAYNSNWIHQIYGDFRTGQLAVRGKNSGTWTGWRTVLDSSNYTSYAPSLTGGSASGTWGINISGTATYATYLNTDSYNAKFHWSGQSGQPTWLWGSNNGADVYVWNPSNFSVSYASSAGTLSNMNISQFTNNSGYQTNGGQVNNLSTNYAGGQQTNPQVYFNNGIGLKVAMTGYPNIWSDTVWINGYTGGDVPYMCALHTIRNSQPRMWISSQRFDATGYGSAYEFLTEWNYTSYSVPLNTNGIYTIGAGNGNAGFIFYGSNYGAGYAGRIYGNNGDGNTYFSARNGSSSFTEVGYLAYTGLYMSYYGSYSDITLKNVIETNPDIDLSGIDVIKYTLKDETISHVVRYGYSAQQVQEILPDVVNTNMNIDGSAGILTLNYNDLHTLKIASLEKKVKELQDQLNQLLNK
jgi:hypothetical protein